MEQRFAVQDAFVALPSTTDIHYLATNFYANRVAGLFLLQARLLIGRFFRKDQGALPPGLCSMHRLLA